MSLSIKFERADVDRFYKAMQRMESELGMSHKHALRTGAQKVLRSLAQSTKVSKPYRDYKEVGVSRSGMNKVYEVTTKYRTPKRKGKALRSSWQGPWRGQLIYAKNEQELKRRSAVMIAMRGAAQESWRQVGQKGKFKIQISKGIQDDPRKSKWKRAMKKAARRWVSYLQVFGKAEQYIKIGNDIEYIKQAMIGGKQTVDTVMQRATKGMIHQIETRLKAKAAAI
jgi:hypothetical protein